MKHYAILGAWLLVCQAVGAADSELRRDENPFPYFVANCFNCHGTEGRSAGGMPSLAGKPEEALLEALLQFKRGQRLATVMHQLSKGYSDTELAVMAHYFSRQVPAVMPEGK